MSDKATRIIAVSIVLATVIPTFFEPYPSCVRTLGFSGVDARNAAEACARWLGGGYWPQSG